MLPLVVLTYRKRKENLFLEMSGVQTTWEPVAALRKTLEKPPLLLRSQDPWEVLRQEVHWEITKSAIE